MPRNDNLETTYRKPQNPFDRMYQAEAAGSILAKKHPDGTVTCQQVLDKTNSYFRELIIHAPKASPIPGSNAPILTATEAQALSLKRVASEVSKKKSQSKVQSKVQKDKENSDPLSGKSAIKSKGSALGAVTKQRPTEAPKSKPLSKDLSSSLDKPLTAPLLFSATKDSLSRSNSSSRVTRSKTQKIEVSVLPVSQSLPSNDFSALLPVFPDEEPKENAEVLGFFSPSSKRAKFPFKVSTPYGTVHTSARSVDIVTTDGAPATLFLFSPDRGKENLAHPGLSGTKRKRGAALKMKGRTLSPTAEMDVSDDENDNEDQRDTETTNFEDVSKGGAGITLTDYERNRKRAKTQLEVMGKSAKEEMKGAMEKLDTRLQQEQIKDDLFDAIEANKLKYDANTIEIMKTLVDNFALEWLHCFAFSLCPKEFDPQQVANLGAGTKWANTQMMPLEKVALYFRDKFLSNSSPAKVTISPTFNMVLDTEVIDEISYVITISTDDHQIQIKSDKIKALALPSRNNWVSASDGPQTIRVINAMLYPEADEAVRVVTSHHRLGA